MLIEDFLNQDCSIIPSTKSLDGKPNESDPVPTKCRVKEKFQIIKNQAAEDVVSKHEFWFSPDTNIDYPTSNQEYLIDYENKKHSVISIENKRDTLGNITRKVVFV